MLVYSLADRTLLTALTGFTGPDGQTESFDRPSGVFAGEDGVVTVADTGNSRVVMLAPDYSLRQIVGSPTGSGVPSGYIFQPIAVAVDKSGRLYAVSRSSAMGVVSFNIDGEFEGFLGAQVVQPSAAELFWRRFMTAEQLERVQKILPTEFNSLTIDDSGFLYVTTSSISKESQYNALITRSRSGDFAPIRRLNPSGDDVLKRSGFFPPAGDVEIRTDGKKDSVVSAFVCAAIGDYGVYSVLDNTRKHIFTYDYDGNLLSVLGGEGVAADQFRALTHAAYHGGKLWVLDGYTGRLTVLRLSGYGTDIMEAIRLTQERQYAQALDTWTELLHKNGNLEMAYIGMGKAYMKSGDYAGAMECYRIVNNREGYSAAYAKQRNASLGNFLLLIPLLAAALALGIIRLSRKLKAYNRAGDLEAARVRGTGEQLAYGFHTIFHPFDGFDEMKRHGRGDVKGAGICLLAALLELCTLPHGLRLSVFRRPCQPAGNGSHLPASSSGLVHRELVRDIPDVWRGKPAQYLCHHRLCPAAHGSAFAARSPDCQFPDAGGSRNPLLCGEPLLSMVFPAAVFRHPDHPRLFPGQEYPVDGAVAGGHAHHHLSRHPAHRPAAKDGELHRKSNRRNTLPVVGQGRMDICVNHRFGGPRRFRL